MKVGKALSGSCNYSLPPFRCKHYLVVPHRYFNEMNVAFPDVYKYILTDGTFFLRRAVIMNKLQKDIEDESRR